jgi:Uma2 family endonuclease
MSFLILDHELGDRLRAERAAHGSDRWDEVWDGVYVMSPLPNDEHQEMVTALATVFQITIRWTDRGQVRAGVNVSDRDEDWKQNYRCPDVAVFLRGGHAVNRGTYWLGGPDFAVEVVSPDDQSRDKIPFYEQVGVRELLVIDRDPWALELYRLRDGRLALAATSTLDRPEVLRSEVVPLTFRLVAASPRPLIEVVHEATGQRWMI